ncbi:hypothetical protein PLICRDRAFT_31051 [Plicaturopsis crispa FD-325 SS-3]|nr:hypothetical protein PLICRDRAFT_31051 [Plicaturopsis crispa FD-325 SS-3]
MSHTGDSCRRVVVDMLDFYSPQSFPLAEEMNFGDVRAEEGHAAQDAGLMSVCQCVPRNSDDVGRASSSIPIGEKHSDVYNRQKAVQNQNSVSKDERRQGRGQQSGALHQRSNQILPEAGDIEDVTLPWAVDAMVWLATSPRIACPIHSASGQGLKFSFFLQGALCT